MSIDMKKIGLVGGLGPASTVYYYLGLIKRCQSQNGKNAYPKIVIDSADMSEHTEAFEKNDYDKICKLLLKSLADLKAAGAELAAITANTEHIVWNKICDRFPLPVISIVDAAVNQIMRDGYKRVLKADAVLLGCTELPLAIKNGDLSVPVLNAADIHINEIYTTAAQD